MRSQEKGAKRERVGRSVRPATKFRVELVRRVCEPLPARVVGTYSYKLQILLSTCTTVDETYFPSIRPSVHRLLDLAYAANSALRRPCHTFVVAASNLSIIRPPNRVELIFSAQSSKKPSDRRSGFRPKPRIAPRYFKIQNQSSDRLRSMGRVVKEYPDPDAIWPKKFRDDFLNSWIYPCRRFSEPRPAHEDTGNMLQIAMYRKDIFIESPFGRRAIQYMYLPIHLLDYTYVNTETCRSACSTTSHDCKK